MNRYGIKGTFNINSGRMGTGGIFRQHDTDIKHYRVKEEDYASLLLRARDRMSHGKSQKPDTFG